MPLLIISLTIPCMSAVSRVMLQTPTTTATDMMAALRGFLQMFRQASFQNILAFPLRFSAVRHTAWLPPV